jgi:hypothetical protein
MKEFHHKYTYVKGRKCVCELKLKKNIDYLLKIIIKFYHTISMTLL